MRASTALGRAPGTGAGISGRGRLGSQLTMVSATRPTITSRSRPAGCRAITMATVRMAQVAA